MVQANVCARMLTVHFCSNINKTYWASLITGRPSYNLTPLLAALQYALAPLVMSSKCRCFEDLESSSKSKPPAEHVGSVPQPGRQRRVRRDRGVCQETRLPEGRDCLASKANDLRVGDGTREVSSRVRWRSWRFLQASFSLRGTGGRRYDGVERKLR